MAMKTAFHLRICRSYQHFARESNRIFRPREVVGTWIGGAIPIESTARNAVLSHPPTSFSCCHVSDIRIRRFGYKPQWDVLEHTKYLSKAELLEILQDEIGLYADESERLLQTHPYISTLTKTDMVRKVTFFKSNLEPSPTEFRRLFKSGMAPVLHFEGFESVIEKAQYIIDFLEDAKGSEGTAARSLILGFPSILTHSRKKQLIPRFSFFQDEVFRGDKAAFVALLLESPEIVLNFSLSKHVQPRVNTMQDAGLDPAEYVDKLRYTKRKFDTWLGETKM